MNTPKISSREELFSTPYFRLVGKRVTGQDSGDPYYALEMSDYVAVVAMTAAGDVVLVRQFRPAVESVTLELPAGTVDAGQTPEQAARRELLEETGFAAGEMTLLGKLRPDTGRLSNQMWVFSALAVERVPGYSGEPGIDVATMTSSELGRSIGDGTFDHALHVAALLLAVRQGHLTL